MEHSAGDCVWCTPELVLAGRTSCKVDALCGERTVPGSAARGAQACVRGQLLHSMLRYRQDTRHLGITQMRLCSRSVKVPFWKHRAEKRKVKLHASVAFVTLPSMLLFQRTFHG